MSQTLLAKAFGVRDGYEYLRTKYVNGTIEFHLAVKEDWLLCPKCGSAEEVIRKGGRFRTLQAVPIGLKPVFLVTEVPRCECKACGELFEVSPPLPRAMSTTPINWRGSSVT
jgi:transposase